MTGSVGLADGKSMRGGVIEDNLVGDVEDRLPFWILWDEGKSTANGRYGMTLTSFVRHGGALAVEAPSRAQMSL